MRAFAAERRVVRDVAGSLLAASHQLVPERHVPSSVGEPSIGAGQAPGSDGDVATIGDLGQESENSAPAPTAGAGATAAIDPARSAGQSHVPLCPGVRRPRRRPARRDPRPGRVQRWRRRLGGDRLQVLHGGVVPRAPARAPEYARCEGRVQLVPAFERPSLCAMGALGVYEDPIQADDPRPQPRARRGRDPVRTDASEDDVRKTRVLLPG